MYVLGWVVSGHTFSLSTVSALSPVKHKGLHQGWTQTSPSYSFHKSIYHKSFFFFLSNSINNFGTQNQRERKKQTRVLEPIYIPRALNTGTCIQQGDLFYSAGLHRNRCQPQLTQEELRSGFGKNAGEWTGRVEISKEEILAVSVACSAIYWPTPGLKWRTFKLCSPQMRLQLPAAGVSQHPYANIL